MKTRNLILMAALAAAGLTSVTGALLVPAAAVAAVWAVHAPRDP